MPVSPWITCLWPGLPQLWLRGQWSGLALATAFTALLNFVLLSSFLWTELVTPTIRSAGWLTLAVTWLVAAAMSWRRLPEIVGQTSGALTEELFRTAQTEYLKGDWFQAESILQRLLRYDPRDADARLMLASLFRHTRRVEDARHQLRTLERLEHADKWQLEIQREREQLTVLATTTNTETESATDP